MKVTIDVPNWRVKLIDHPEILESLCEGLEPGLHYLKVEHEKFCAEQLGRGVCNCEPQFKVERYGGQ